jgi:hypothetical protein
VIGLDSFLPGENQGHVVPRVGAARRRGGLRRLVLVMDW